MPSMQSTSLDEDTGEYTFGRSIEASADVRIKAGSSKASVQMAFGTSVSMIE
ncbi:MAG: hypothetical protein ACI3ZQ_09870 [Candidatus Cryptobacteroides sp.]